MLTFLSRSILRLFSGLRGRKGPRALPAHTEAPELAKVLPLRPGHGAAVAANHDIPVALPSASAFVAGHGARIYSLDVFRDARRGGGAGPRPHAA